MVCPEEYSLSEDLQGKRSKNVLFTFDETILRGSHRV